MEKSNNYLQRLYHLEGGRASGMWGRRGNPSAQETLKPSLPQSQGARTALNVKVRQTVVPALYFCGPGRHLRVRSSETLRRDRGVPNSLTSYKVLLWACCSPVAEVPGLPTAPPTHFPESPTGTMATAPPIGSTSGSDYLALLDYACT